MSDPPQPQGYIKPSRSLPDLISAYKSRKNNITPAMATDIDQEIQLLSAAASGNLSLIHSSPFALTILPKLAEKAAKAPHPSILSWTLTNGLTFPQESQNDPIYHAACESGSIAIFEVLLAHGLDLNKHTSFTHGDALSYACMKGNLPLIKFLLSHSHDINSNQRCNDRLALVWAVTHDSYFPETGLEILKLLLKCGIQVEGTGAAIAAAEKDNLEALVLLLDRGAGMEEVVRWWGECEKWRNEEEGTALFRACVKGKGRTVEYLIGRGARTDVEGSEGSSPYEVAENKRFGDVVKFLEVCGVTVEWPD